MKLKLKSVEEDKSCIEVDTDNMNDAHAAVLEKAEEFRLLCKDYNINYGLFFEADKNKILSSFAVDGTLKRVIDFWFGVQRIISEYTNDKMQLVFMHDSEDDEEGFNTEHINDL